MIRDLERRDAADVAKLCRELEPEFVATEEGVWHEVTGPPERALSRAWVAESGGALQGAALAGLEWTVPTGDVGWIWFGVHGAARRRGLGGELYRLAEDHMRVSGANRILAYVVEGSEAESFLERRGFRVKRTDRFSQLTVSAAPDLPQVDGFHVVALRDVADIRGVYQVYASGELDMPSDFEHSELPFDEWERETLGNPHLDWEGSKVVLAGERPVAVSFLKVDREGGMAENEMTATHPDFRRRGLARLAKLAGIRWAAENGIGVILTGNDAENAGMLAINRELGYRPKVVRSGMLREL
jgi:GNAT superfamily N-acetyltransferase